MARTVKPKIIHVKTDSYDFDDFIDGKGFDEVIQAFEKLREQYAEYIFLYGFDVKFEVNSWGSDFWINVHRTESPLEVEQRIERNRIAAEKRKESAEKNKLKKQKQAEDKERKLYEQLKAKFEPM